MISFLFDENMPGIVLTALREAGYNCVRLKVKGISDPEVLKIAKASKRAVVTFDRGFANTLQYPPEKFHGIVLMRRKSANVTLQDIRILTKQLVEHLLTVTTLKGELCIVERAKVRKYCIDKSKR
jgi:predicted nuclease of predicted toxin-antitoxin system